ncbi:MAG: hypothetical protein AAFZ01_05390 [Pseudomonadota bacterium]
MADFFVGAWSCGLAVCDSFMTLLPGAAPMTLILKILTLVSAAVAVVCVGLFLYAGLGPTPSDGTGMAVLAFYLWGGLASMATLAFGVMTYLAGRGDEPPDVWLGKLGMVFGIAGVAVIMGLPALVG